MSFIPIAIDKPYKFYALGSLAAIVAIGGYAYFAWEANSKERFEIDKRAKVLQVDVNRWADTMTKWDAAIERRKQLDFLFTVSKQDKNQPTDPLTKEEEDAIRKTHDQYKDNKNMIMVPPDSVIRGMNFMREAIRESPPPDFVQQRIKEADEQIAEFVTNNKGLEDFRDKINKSRIEIASDEALLKYKQQIAYGHFALCVFLMILLFPVVRSGFKKWEGEGKAAS